MFASRVQQSSTSTGLGSFSLGAIAAGMRAFSAAVGVGPSFAYAIVADSGDWEEGIGHLADAATLIRRTVLRSSNGDGFVSFGAGAKTVFCTLPGDLLGLGNQAPAQPAIRLHFGV